MSVKDESFPWVACVARSEAKTTAALRLWPGIEACQVEDALWLRGEKLDESLDLALRKLSGATLYNVYPDGRLLRRGARVPGGKPPGGRWVALETWIALDPQPAALPGLPTGSTGRVHLELTRTTVGAEPTLLVTHVRPWVQYASGAPAVRLKPLAFAAAADGRVLIRGRPLPSLPGKRYVEVEGIAVPCGFAWSPPVDAEVLRELLELAPGDIAVLEGDGTYEHVGSSGFVPATRSAARRSLEGPSRG